MRLVGAFASSLVLCLLALTANARDAPPWQSGVASTFPPGCFEGETSEIWGGRLSVVNEPDNRIDGAPNPSPVRIFRTVRAPKHCAVSSGISGSGVRLVVNYDGSCTPFAIRDNLRPSERDDVTPHLSAGSTLYREDLTARLQIGYTVDALGPGGMDFEKTTVWTAGPDKTHGLHVLRHWRRGGPDALERELVEVPQPRDVRYLAKDPSGAATAFVRCSRPGSVPNPICEFETTFGISRFSFHFNATALADWRSHRHLAFKTMACALVEDDYPGVEDGAIQRWRRSEYP